MGGSVVGSDLFLLSRSDRCGRALGFENINVVDRGGSGLSMFSCGWIYMFLHKDFLVKVLSDRSSFVFGAFLSLLAFFLFGLLDGRQAPAHDDTS